METEKALAVLAASDERFEASNKEPREVDKKIESEFAETGDLTEEASEAQTLADITTTAASHTRSNYRRLATTFDEAEVDLKEGLHRIHRYGDGHGSIADWHTATPPRGSTTTFRKL